MRIFVASLIVLSVLYFWDNDYNNGRLLDGLDSTRRRAGGELFIDVNVPSKAFGELVESRRHTPSLSAREIDRLIAEKADVVVLDSRRFEEYRTMSIPTGTSRRARRLTRSFEGP
jgi:hypothetical protein